MVALGLFGCIISIHALRVEGDPVLLTSILCYCGVIISSVFSKKNLIFGETPDILYLFGFPPDVTPFGGVELIVPSF